LPTPTGWMVGGEPSTASKADIQIWSASSCLSDLIQQTGPPALPD
jgi:hypothetical protein